MLQSVDGDWPLRDLCLIVAGPPLTGLLRIRGKPAGEHNRAIGPPRGCDAFGLADMAEFDEHGIGVILRHDPAAHHWATERMLAVAILPDRTHLLQVRQDRFYHSDPDVALHSPCPNVHHAYWRLDKLQFRQHAKLFGEYCAADDGVEKPALVTIAVVLSANRRGKWEPGRSGGDLR